MTRNMFKETNGEKSIDVTKIDIIKILKNIKW